MAARSADSSTHLALAKGGNSEPSQREWLQVPRSSMVALAGLMTVSRSAANVLAQITARMGQNNAFVASNSSIAEFTQTSVPTVKRALKFLQERQLINILRLGSTQSVRVIIVNDQVAWFGPRSGLRHSLFSAAVYVSEAEQDKDELAGNGELHQISDMHMGEPQCLGEDVPLPPAAQPSSNMEPELSARDAKTGMAEPKPIGDIVAGLELTASAGFESFQLDTETSERADEFDPSGQYNLDELVRLVAERLRSGTF